MHFTACFLFKFKFTIYIFYVTLVICCCCVSWGRYTVLNKRILISALGKSDNLFVCRIVQERTSLSLVYRRPIPNSGCENGVSLFGLLLYASLPHPSVDNVCGVFHSQAAYKRLASHAVIQKVLGKLLASHSKYVGEVHHCASRWKSSESVVRYNWPMSAHVSQAFSIAHCTDSGDLPKRTK